VKYLFVATYAAAGSSACISRLHLEHGTEEVLGRRRQKLDLGVRVQAVQVRTLRRQNLVDEGVVAQVVAVRRNWKSRSKVQLAVHLHTT